MKVAGEGPLDVLFDEADRIVANLETETGARRLTQVQDEVTA